MLPEYSRGDVRVSRAISRHPQRLAKHLTEGKESEKARFDAIFAWVASNIRYDFNAYFSSGGAGTPRVNRILKYRKGICLDYAYLMDTLCRLAGITNVTVPGYAKDEIFDVQDSLYLDDHAWNAVKLDGLWYVYDVTWASGRPEYHFTRFSRFIDQLRKRYPPRYKIKRIVVERKLFLSYCDEEGIVRPPDTITYYKQRFWNRKLISLLRKFKLRVERYTTQRIDTAFYLCDPETFAVTHFPDDPMWGLVASRNVRDYEGDSAYYHFHDSVYRFQERYGRACPDCDGFISYNELNKHLNFRRESLKFNRRNRFATMISEFGVGRLKLLESVPVEDSLSKVMLLDTAMAWEERARQSLYQSALNIEEDFYLQRNKNSHKADLLYTENAAYSNFVRGEKFKIKVQSKSVKDLQRKTGLAWSQFVRCLGRTKNLSDNEAPNPKVKTTPYKLLELQGKRQYFDSLVRVGDHGIDSLRSLLEANIRTLSSNLKPKLLEHDSVFSLFALSTRLRYYQRDNYKKDIVELRKRILSSTRRYMNNLDSMVYGPSAACAEIGDQLFRTIELRNDAEGEVFSLLSELVRRSLVKPGELKAYKQQMIRKIREDLCWLEKNEPKLLGLFDAFSQFTQRQSDASSVIRAENQVEGYRVRIVNKELSRRRKKYKKIVLHNTKVVNSLLRLTRREKRLFLKRLRDERREAARRKK